MLNSDEKWWLKHLEKRINKLELENKLVAMALAIWVLVEAVILTLRFW